MSINSALLEFGLSARESQIYLVLRKHGPLSVAEIARRSSIPRISVYDCLGNLQAREIVGTLKKNRRQLYEALPPSMLLQILKQKALSFESAIPLLEAFGQSKKDDFAVQMYEGQEQCRQAQRDFNECIFRSKVKLVQSVSHPDLAKRFPRFVPSMIQRRQRMGILTQLLLSSAQKGAVPASFAGPLREIRFLPGKFLFNCTCSVSAGSTLFIVTEHRDPIALLVRSRSVSDVISTFFSYIWEQLGTARV